MAFLGKIYEKTVIDNLLHYSSNPNYEYHFFQCKGILSSANSACNCLLVLIKGSLMPQSKMIAGIFSGIFFTRLTTE